jgi:hypothetical protein
MDNKIAMMDEWKTWQRVVDALTKCSAAIDINQEPLLAAAIELWGESLVGLREGQTKKVRLDAFKDKRDRYNRLLTGKRDGLDSLRELLP